MHKENFNQEYFGSFKGKVQFRDVFRQAIDILPTESDERNSSFKAECGLNGITGEFMRLLFEYDFDPVQDVSDLFEKVQNYLNTDEQFSMFDDENKKTLLQVAKEVLYAGNKMAILDPSFFIYLPLTANNVDENVRKKYEDSQKKLAHYLYDMLDFNSQHTPQFQNKNLLVSILRKAISDNTFPRNENFGRHYTILPFVKNQFNRDLKWFFEEHNESAISQYLPLFLYFYVCYSLIQLVLNLNPKDLQENSNNKAHPLYYMLASEAASSSKPAVRYGWDEIAKNSLPKMLAKLQTLDILNCILEEDVSTKNPIGFYPDIFDELKKTTWDVSVKTDCEEILNKYQTEKKSVLKNRGDVANKNLGAQPDKVFDVNSYDEFINALYELCSSLNTADYLTRFANKISDILRVKLLSIRRGYRVLALDEDTLLFLIALATKEKPTRLKDMYSALAEYGIVFSQETTSSIENYLLNFNLLDRKSDSGEAQYVTVVL